MAENSKISWTTHTFNPWWGCTKVSKGCERCYADAQSKRFGHNVWGPKAGRRMLSDAYWLEPRKWNADAEAVIAAGGERPRVFCASMADVFEGPETCQNEEAYAAISRARQKLFGLIYLTPNLDWLLLTKRPQNILGMVPDSYHLMGFPPNVWIGTSLENQDVVMPRLSHLSQIPAVVRFVSAEPLLGSLDLTIPHFACQRCGFPLGFNPELDEESGTPEEIAAFARYCASGCEGCGNAEGWCASDMFIHHIDWIIVGGESGHGARIMEIDWARSLRDQAVDFGVAFHFKQHGEWRVMGNDCPLVVGAAFADRGENSYLRVGKSDAGRILDGRTWDEFPTPKLERLKGANSCVAV